MFGSDTQETMVWDAEEQAYFGFTRSNQHEPTIRPDWEFGACVGLYLRVRGLGSWGGERESACRCTCRIGNGFRHTCTHIDSLHMTSFLWN
jgi:hypothetical protein